MAAKTGKPLEPVVLAVHSQNIHAELNGWRTEAGLMLRQPIAVSAAYTPALAKQAHLNAATDHAWPHQSAPGQHPLTGQLALCHIRRQHRCSALAYSMGSR